MTSCHRPSSNPKRPRALAWPIEHLKMVHERRYDMLKHHRRWRDKISSIFAILLFLFLSINISYVYLSRTTPFTKMFSTFMYNPHGIDWTRTFGIICLSPLLSYILSVSVVELLILIPSIVVCYGRFTLIVIDCIILAATVWIWNNGIAIGAALLAIFFSFTFYLGRNHSIWRFVLCVAREQSSLVPTRLLPTFLASVISSLVIFLLASLVVIGHDVWKPGLVDFNSIFLLLTIWIVHYNFQLILRGMLTSHYINKLFLRGSPYMKPYPMLQSVVQLSTRSFGTIFLAAMYYGGRNAAVQYALGTLIFSGDPFRMLSYDDQISTTTSVGTIFSNLLILYLVSSQRYRSLFQVVAYAYSFSESLMLTEVYPAMKIDLLNKLTNLISFLIAFLTGTIAHWMLRSFGAMMLHDATRLSFLISIHAYMVSLLVFEPIRAVSFTLAVGLVEDPKYLLQTLPWVRSYYPPFS